MIYITIRYTISVGQDWGECIVEMSMELRVFHTLLGDLLPEYAPEWVEEIFVPGNPCHEEYSRMLEAYQRVCTRLGSGEEDADLEIIVDSLLAHGKILALEMFRCGVRYGNMDNTVCRESHTGEKGSPL